jgi:dUTP pyrophosphatase
MRKFEIVSERFLQYGESEIKLPFRATKSSAGYDFFSPIDIIITPGKRQLIWTNVKAQFNDNEMLMLLVTSKMGKNGVILANGVGIIESDYYSNESNDGNLGFILCNLGESDYVIKKGDKIGQGVFTTFLTIDNEKEIKETRKGGFGSTAKG